MGNRCPEDILRRIQTASEKKPPTAEAEERGRKIIVGLGKPRVFQIFCKRYDAWLDDVEIYFIDADDKVNKIR